MSDSDEDQFEDAREAGTEGPEITLPPGVEDDVSNYAPRDIAALPSDVDREILNDNIMRGVELFFSNKFGDAERVWQTYRDSDPLHALAFAVSKCLMAMMSFAPADIAAAHERLQAGESLAAAVIKRSEAQRGVGGLLGKMKTLGQKNTLPPQEFEAAVCLAECHLLSAVLLLLEENIVSYIKAGLNLRKGWLLYQSTWATLQSVGASGFDAHAVGGVQFGIGNFNMIISMLPEKILKVVSAFGFPANREVGLQNLQLCFKSGTVRSVLAGLSLLFYNVVFPSFFSAPTLKENLEVADQVIFSEEKKYPDSCVHLCLHARLLRMKRDLPGAVKMFERCVAIQDEWRQVKDIGRYELGMTHLFLGNFGDSRKYSVALGVDSEWSKGFYAYLTGVCLVCEGKREDALLSLQQVPALCQRRFGGRILSVEQFCSRKVKTYCSGTLDRFIIPDLELVFLWNGFSQMDVSLLALTLSSRALPALAKERSRSPVDPNLLALTLLISGSCYRHLGQLDEAEKCFREIEGMQHLLTEERHLPAFTHFELGSLYVSRGQKQQALTHFNRAKEFKDYNFEFRAHLRIHLSVDALTR